MEIEIIAIIAAIAGILISIKIVPSIATFSKFSYSNAKFSAIPNTFLKEKEISRLLESKGIDELKNNVVSRDFILKGESIKEIQNSIDKSLIKIIKMARNDSPKKVAEFYDAYMKKIDSYTIKDVIIAIKESREIENKAILEENREMIEKIKQEREKAGEILEEYGWKIDLTKPIEEIERDVEIKAISFLEKAKLPSSSKKARDRFVKSLIDILNLKAILRGKYYNMDIYLYGEGWELPIWKLKELIKIEEIEEIISMIEGTSYFGPLKNAITDFEKEGVMALEKALDKHLLEVARQIANDNPLGIGPGIRFLVEKEFEARNLKAVVKAIGEQMPEIAKKLVVVE